MKRRARSGSGSSLPFFLIHAQPNCERKAFEWIVRFGVEPYLPLSSIDDQPPKPFFPRYLFAREAGHVDPISLRYLYGVSNVVRAGNGMFARVDDDVVDALRQREIDGVIQFHTPPPKPLRNGQRVAINVGSGSDVIGTFLRMKGEDRAQVLVSLFDRNTTQVISLHRLRRMI